MSFRSVRYLDVFGSLRRRPGVWMCDMARGEYEPSRSNPGMKAKGSSSLHLVPGFESHRSRRKWGGKRGSGASGGSRFVFWRGWAPAIEY